MNNFKLGVKILRLELIYIISSIIFLVNLHRLNNRLVSENFGDNVFKLLAYESYKPIWYFIVALVFLYIGVRIIFYRVSEIREEDYRDAKEIIIRIIGIAILIVLLPIIIQMIYIPILRAIIMAATLIMGGAYLLSENG